MNRTSAPKKKQPRRSKSQGTLNLSLPLALKENIEESAKKQDLTISQFVRRHMAKVLNWKA